MKVYINQKKMEEINIIYTMKENNEFLFNKNNHFNLANIVTFFNIASGIFAIYF